MNDTVVLTTFTITDIFYSKLFSKARGNKLFVPIPNLLEFLTNFTYQMECFDTALHIDGREAPFVAGFAVQFLNSKLYTYNSNSKIYAMWTIYTSVFLYK